MTPHWLIPGIDSVRATLHRTRVVALLAVSLHSEPSLRSEPDADFVDDSDADKDESAVEDEVREISRDQDESAKRPRQSP